MPQALQRFAARPRLAVGGLALVAAISIASRADEPDVSKLPPAAQGPVDFHKDVLPILARRCAICHTDTKQEGNFSLTTREKVLAGGDSGEAVIVGNSAKSPLVHLVAGVDPDRIMPAKGERLSAEEVGVLRAWIDGGLAWEDGLRIDRAAAQAPLEPRRPELPPAPDASVTHPIDRLLDAYGQAHQAPLGAQVDDRVFARRAYLDLIGLLPPPAELVAFEQDSSPDKRAQLVRRLLSEREDFAFHWLTFWNDLLRNDYRGTGFIDKGREQITGWLFESIYTNKPYDQFVRELISPIDGSVGFTKGLYWRGVVNASQRREMQASQSIGQALLGANLKCASCHDSFVNHWKLSDAYGLAAVFASEPLEVHRCDKPTGEIAQAAFVFSQLGKIDPAGSVKDRTSQLAKIITDPRNGRLARTVVNRLWERFFGRGIVAQVDDMDQTPFSADLLDWLAADFQDHGYDLNHTIELICTSRAYQAASVPPPTGNRAFVFAGPLTRHISAEQFVDAVSTLTGDWQPETPEMLSKDGRGQGGQLTAVSEVLARQRQPEGSLPLVAGRDGQALQFDGKIQTIRVAHHVRLKPNEQLSIMAWISPRDCPDSWQTIYRKEDGAGRTLFAIGGANERFGLWLGLGLDGKYREFNVPLVRIDLKDGSWHHVAVVYDGKHVRHYLDGREVRHETASGRIDVRGDGPAFIGSNSGTTEFFGGGIDDLRIYDHAISAADIKTLYSGAEPKVEPVARWRLDGDLKDSVSGADGVFQGPQVRPRVLRAAIAENSPLLSSLGRPTREQIVSVRDPLTTTLQALELTNGIYLDAALRRGAERWAERSLPARLLVEEIYAFALGRAPTEAEAKLGEQRLGNPAPAENIQDFLWEVLMLPEFQLIY